MRDIELWLVFAMAFGAVLLGVQGLWYFAHSRRETKAINRRLVLSQTLGSQSEVLDALRRERGLGGSHGLPFLSRFEESALQTGMKVDVTYLAVLTIGLATGFFLLFRWSTGWTIISFALSIIIAPIIVYLALQWIRHKRILKFGEQLPDALDVIVRGLRAGHPFRVAVGLVGREMQDPIGSEFGILADEIAFGSELTTAATNLIRRVGQDDLVFFAIAVNIQDQTGGNLGEILSRLASLVRSRSKLRLKVRALTAEGRLSAIFLSLAPFVLFGVISLISPSFFLEVRDHPALVPIVVIGFILLAIGNFIMYRMVHFKV